MSLKLDAATDLVERADELAIVDGAVHAAAAGAGAVVLVEGPAGIGKTGLLTEAIARGRAAGMLVLCAQGAELERSFPYVVVRQLFEHLLSAADGETRARLLSGAAVHARTVVDPRAEPESAAVEPAAVLHGLYWLVANLADDRPLLLVVDDVHWSDPASVSWLGYLARRLEGLAVALVLGARSAEPGTDRAHLQRLRATDGLRRVEPAPLGHAAVHGLGITALGDQVQPAFSAACHAATGGNPFYVAELLRALAQDRVTGTAASASAISGLTPRTVVDATMTRLGRMPADARAVAEAVALLEPRAELRWIAELTALDVDAAAAAADSLLALGMLRSVTPCRFEHPILRSAVESTIAPARCGRLHLTAARALAAGGMAAQAVCAHLMATPPCGESWVLSTLRQAAAQASARGAPESAAAYLERSLAERPAAPERREILLDLGKAESQLKLPRAQQHLRQALALSEDPEDVAAAAFLLGQMLFTAGAFDESFEAINAAVDRTDGHEGPRTLELQAFLLAIAGPAGRMVETADRAYALEAMTSPDSPMAGTVQGCLALREIATGRPRLRVHERAELAMADIGRVFASGAARVGRDLPGMAFLWTDDLDRAEKLFTGGIDDATRMGKRRSFEIFSALRGYAMRRRGELADAAADIEPVLASAARGESPGAATLIALTTQVLLLIDHGQPDAAEALAQLAPIPAAYERLPFVAQLRHAEGVAQLAQRKLDEAATTLTVVGEVCDANAILSPAMIPWRSELALALAGSDRHDDGVELARTELRLAERSDVDRSRGVALRALGMLEGGDGGLRLLAAAVLALERSPARLELGWASYELGAALRRAKRRRDARAPLDRALDIALECGAGLLGRRATEELRALGARPRSVLRSGAESLTPSELRVCRLAAQGLKNGEIAQALFVTPKTVETHLSSSYRKLDLSSRTRLADALGTTRT